MEIALRNINGQVAALMKNLNGAHWAVIGQGVSSATNFLITLIITWGAGLTTYGHYALCYLVALFYRNLMDGALLHPVGSIGPKIGEKSAEIYRGFIGASFLGYVAFVSITFIAFALFARNFTNIAWLESGYLISLFFIISLVSTEMLRNYLLIFDQRLLVIFCDVTRCVLQISLLAAVVWLGDGHITTILGAVALGGFLSIIPFVFYFGKVSFRPSKWKTFFLRHARYVKWAMPSIALRYAQTNIPFYWAASVLGADVIGAARAIQSLANVINIPLNGLRSILPAISARIYRRQGAGAMKSYLMHTTLILSSINAVTIVFFIFFSDFVIDLLFDDSVGQYSYMLWMYVVINALMVINMTLTAGFQALEEPKILAIRFFIGAILSVILSYLFMERFGAISLPAIQITSAVFSVVFFMGRFQARTKENEVGK